MPQQFVRGRVPGLVGVVIRGPTAVIRCGAVTVDTLRFREIVAATHPEPQTVLGPHLDAGVLVIRAFRPDARAVFVELRGRGQHPMRRLQPEGLFELRLDDWDPRAPLPRGDAYELIVDYDAGRYRLHDPYSCSSWLGALDVHLLAEGNHEKLYQRLGAHRAAVDGLEGTAFAVWAPRAQRVSLVGDFNGWDGRIHPMCRREHGLWELFVPGVGTGAFYRFELLTPNGTFLHSDPMGQWFERRPKNASRVFHQNYTFSDDAWIAARPASDLQRKPLSIYEVHLPSWRRSGRTSDVDGEDDWLTYRELADQLVDYVVELGFTHVELLPVMEHPYDGSWGYQVTGYFAPTSRLGTPDDFRYFVDRCHLRGIGVLLDWVPAHFPRDGWALARFDGEPLYEPADPRRAEHKHWDTLVFDYGRPEVKNFLIASALYWLDEFHIDGIRVDAVASLLYLDYAGGESYVPNEHGGRENLAAIAFIRELNDRIHKRFPGVITIAEESTTWPGVTQPTYLGGLGFDFKWNMGWMHDTLDYFALDPVFRAFHHQLITFGITYIFTERFMLPLSHDEVVHLKKSLVSKMPGDKWKMLAGLRILLTYQWTHPGKKLLFMGGEFAQWREWTETRGLDWHLLDDADHRGVKLLMAELNRLYRDNAALHEVDDSYDGFRWIDPNDSMQSTASYIRYAGHAGKGYPKKGKHVVVVINFTPMVRRSFRLGVPRPGAYLEILNTDSESFGGSGVGNLGRVAVEEVPSHGFALSVSLSLPPMGALVLVPEDVDGEDVELKVAAPTDKKVKDGHAAIAPRAELSRAPGKGDARGREPSELDQAGRATEPPTDDPEPT